MGNGPRVAMSGPRPSLVSRARLKWDAVRNTHVLLLPEGLLMLHGAAGVVLEKTDGVRDLDAILAALWAEFPEVDPDEIRRDTRELFQSLTDRGLVSWTIDP